MMKYHGMTYEQALAAAKAVRPAVDPYPGFVKIVRREGFLDF